jgi:hypothetical protein
MPQNVIACYCWLYRSRIVLEQLGWQQSDSMLQPLQKGLWARCWGAAAIDMPFRMLVSSEQKLLLRAGHIARQLPRASPQLHMLLGRSNAGACMVCVVRHT